MNPLRDQGGEVGRAHRVLGRPRDAVKGVRPRDQLVERRQHRTGGRRRASGVGVARPSAGFGSLRLPDRRRLGLEVRGVHRVAERGRRQRCGQSALELALRFRLFNIKTRYNEHHKEVRE